MLTLRARLTVGVLALISGLVVGLLVLESLQLRQLLENGAATRLRAQAKALVDEAAAGELDATRAGRLATDLTSADTGALVFTPDGAVLGAPRAGTIGAPPPSDVPLAAIARSAAGDLGVDVVRDTPTGRELLVLVPEPGSRPPRAVIALVTSLADDDAVAGAQLLASLVALVAVLLLAAIGSLLLVGRALAPLRRISRTAAKVAAGDLGQRVHLAGPRDEVRRLAEAFDGMTAALQTSFAELAESERRSRAFVADASHELRTPLTTVGGFTDVLLRRPAQDEQAVRLLASLRREVDRMQRVVDDLLLLAQADQGLGSAREPVDVRAAAERVVEQIRPVAAGRRLVVDGGPVIAATDPDRLHRILLNLVVNAVRHTDPGGSVTLCCTAEGGRAVVTVSDDGEGMSPEVRAVAFERFARGTRRGEGSGLGLAIVAALVDDLDGDVRLASAPGAGTEVRVELPVRKTTGPPPTW